MKRKQHSKKTLFNCKCDSCDDSAHSLEEDFTFIDLSISEEPMKITIRTKVCLRCGPVLIFEVPEELSSILEEALVMAGYDLDAEYLEIRKT